MANPPLDSATITQRGALKKDDNNFSVGWNFLNIVLAAPTTTAVKVGAGVLHTITFNKPVATAVVTIYDSLAASGTLIGTITIPASPMPVTLIFDAAFATGLTIVTATAAQDITVTYI